MLNIHLVQSYVISYSIILVPFEIRHFSCQSWIYFHAKWTFARIPTIDCTTCATITWGSNYLVPMLACGTIVFCLMNQRCTLDSQNLHQRLVCATFCFFCFFHDQSHELYLMCCKPWILFSVDCNLLHQSYNLVAVNLWNPTVKAYHPRGYRQIAGWMHSHPRWRWQTPLQFHP